MADFFIEENKREHARKALITIKNVIEQQRKLCKLGIDVSEFTNDIIPILEESVALVFSKDGDSFKGALENVQWWLYENVEKHIFIKHDGVTETLDVTNVDDFLRFLEKEML